MKLPDIFDLAALHTEVEQCVSSSEWVESDQRLAELCVQWQQHASVGLDTEFIRTDTFYPIPGLIQISCQGRCYLIDPLAISDFSPFVELLTNPKVVKILHACGEDLELFAHSYGAAVASLFDTQVACAFLDMGLSIGYQRLLQDLFEVALDKEETRSDWLQRPLTEAQQRYAALDVAYLGVLYALLREQLEAEGKLDWLLADCDKLALAAVTEEDPETSYLQRFKQAWKCNPRQLVLLKTLSTWREIEARKQDMPRNFLVHNNSMMAMVLKPPKSMYDLGQIEKMRRGVIKKQGATILKLVEQGLNSDEPDVPAPPRPLPPTANAKLKAVRKEVGKTAEALGIAPELLAKRKDMEELIRSGLDDGQYRLPSNLEGWREAVIGQKLLDVLKNHKD